MKIGPKGIALIKEFEGYHTRLSDGSCVAYLDTLAARKYWSKGFKGLWTIGWGCTGTDVTEGTHWTLRQAEEGLLRKIKPHEDAVNRLIKVTLNQHQFDALVSLFYNVGAGGCKTMIRLINNGEFDKAANQFLTYNKAGGKVLKGLVRRRTAEKELFQWEVPAEVYSFSTKMKVNYWTRFTAAVGSVFGYFTWDNMTQARTFLSDNAGLILLGTAGVIFIVTKMLDKKTIQDFDEDRYIPSGMNTNKKVDWDV